MTTVAPRAGVRILGRLGRPEEIAAVVRFLLSADASCITGHAIVVDGDTTAID